VIRSGGDAAKIEARIDSSAQEATATVFDLGGTEGTT